MTPLEKLNSLTRDKKTAFLALFDGASSRIIIYCNLVTGKTQVPVWGKAECEWIEDWENFYFKELVDLGFMKPEKLEEFVCLGMGNGKDWLGTEWKMQITNEGFQARQDYRNDLKRKIKVNGRAQS